ncbi:hypothetical protein Ctob_010262 [Chrysochromulina tobinii]|uniref:Uncharacterized protein n=1 Tax=Chrysochromulina tobinii TaxID=1460289 RepID=A0A0M0JRG3_9EUKA|nr:hypothetical protein Ctob_010262 [Chrysochromulina tobinii]|eukprot:KOO29191.1 hypothetical protein Ctob_010262 [Chrysochromulina sp. CCMP291]
MGRRNALSSLAPEARAKSMRTPASAAPRAFARSPTNWYLPNVEARSATPPPPLLRSASTACSTGVNGPTSPPAGLTTPMVPAIASSVNELVVLNAIAAKTASAEPTTSVALRLRRSALVVR